MRLARRGEAGFTPSGYHHLGANTGGEWAGVSGRMSIVDGSIRPRSYDFVAGRFMVKRNLGRGVINWLEAGWAETGWAGTGRQHIYTFNTNTKTWQFYDQYVLRPGDKVWLDLHSDPDGVWSAWLWWGNRWNLLTAQRLPIGETAVVEQYVEVHVDAGRPGLIDVPPVTVDNVRLRPAGGGEPRLWREDVPTLTGTDPTQRQQRGGFCLDWRTRYDTWTAGDCSRSGLLRSAVAPAPPLPLGDADVVGAPTPAAPEPGMQSVADPGPAAAAPGGQAEAPGTQAEAPGTQAEAPGTGGTHVAPETQGAAPGGQLARPGKQEEPERKPRLFSDLFG
ncbi:hypothetical protein [Actinoplanes sp. NPDC048796]|uniref:hypothetical protein n=1 Tax=unclassified Actinoplanes TaxID=2626549 RepID=UPI0033CF45E2